MKKLLMIGEFAERVGLDKETVQQWESMNLIHAAGYTEDDVPVYEPETIDKVHHIKKLQELGYSLEEILKIEKKVGMPSLGTEKGGKKQSKYLTIGNLAEKVGISARTIKHWEDKRIIEPDTRSEGGFRLYSRAYVYLCNLIKDLQLFGYSLEEIKDVSDYVRDFLDLQENFESISHDQTDKRIETLLKEIAVLTEKMDSLKQGIARWDDLLKKKKKEILSIQGKNVKRRKEAEGHAQGTKPQKKSGKKSDVHAKEKS